MASAVRVSLADTRAIIADKFLTVSLFRDSAEKNFWQSPSHSYFDFSSWRAEIISGVLINIPWAS